jgi:hypothetical protein
LRSLRASGAEFFPRRRDDSGPQTRRANAGASLGKRSRGRRRVLVRRFAKRLPVVEYACRRWSVSVVSGQCQWSVSVRSDVCKQLS